MLDVMLIDDDTAILDYLEDVISWEELGLRPACRACDSETAQELFLRLRPRIVITDINIPIQSGLELARQFLEIDPALRVIIITGFSEFDNVRSAVSIGAIDLLTKPIVPEEINASLAKAVDHFRVLRQRYQTEQALDELLRENHSLLQERWLSRLLTQDQAGQEEALRQQLQLLKLEMPEPHFAAVALKLHTERTSALGAAFPAAFQSLCRDSFLANGFHALCCYSGSDRLDILLNFAFSQGDERAEAVLTKLLEECRFYFQTGFTAAIGSIVDRLDQVFLSARQAQLAWNIGDDSGTGVVNFRNLGRPETDFLPPPPETLTELLQEGHMSELRRTLLQESQRLSPEAMQAMALDLLSHMSQLCYQSQVYPWSSLNYPDTVAQIFSAATSQEAAERTLSALEALHQALQRQRSESKNRLIQLAKDYIQKNLGDSNLSLETVSSQIGLSRIYFGQLFSKEEGVSFNVYLNQQRVELAKKLLRTTVSRVGEISSQIGYSNPKYFNYVFKHLTGVTPLDYRNHPS